MRTRTWATGTAVIVGASAMVMALPSDPTTEILPPNLASVEISGPEPFDPPGMAGRSPMPSIAEADPIPVAPRVTALSAPRQDTLPRGIEPPSVAWSHEIAAGETLDAVLTEAGLAAPERSEAALALGVEYDLRRLRPGHGIDVVSTVEGRLHRITLRVEDGIRIEATFGERRTTRTVAPETELVTLAGQARVETSLFAALDEAGMPPRFVVDLAQMLGDVVDFRRDLDGDETLRLMWRQAHVGDDPVGQPDLAFAALDLGDALWEVAWPEDGTGRATIYLDGEVQRTFAQPVEGARLSSVFGRRIHPVYGDMRMHTGVDFAAATGTPVRATAAGRIAFVGRRGGYGRVVELAHGSGTMTRYAHLSAVADGAAVGQRVSAGDTIGRVGATGTATGPNLHYEVLVDGRPTDPLSDERLAEAAGHGTRDGAARARLMDARTRLTETLADNVETEPMERL